MSKHYTQKELEEKRAKHSEEDLEELLASEEELTTRQVAILDILNGHQEYERAAAKLGISVEMVKKEVTNAKRKIRKQQEAEDKRDPKERLDELKLANEMAEEGETLPQSTDRIHALAKADSPLDLEEGLTDRQIAIQGLKLRGWSHRQIAKAMSIDPAVVNREASKIRQINAKRGLAVNRPAEVGEFAYRVDLIASEGWKIYDRIGGSKAKDPNQALKALGLTSTLEEKRLKAYQDLGLVERAASEHKITHDAAPELLKQMDSQRLANAILEAHMDDIEDPDDVVDAEFKELEDVTGEYPED